MNKSLRYLTGEGFRNIKTNKLMSLASVTVLMSCMLIIGVAALLFANINAVLDGVEAQNIIKVFIDENATEEEVTQLGNQIAATDNVAKVEFISRDTAFGSIVNSLGESSSVMDALDSSFLPDSYSVTVADMSRFDETVAAVSALDHIVSVRENMDLADTLTNLRDSVTWACIGIIALLFVVALFIIGNTVRVSIFSRRLEISIMKAVGATKNFIRWPFLIEGVTLGIVSAALTVGLLYVLYSAVVNLFFSTFHILGVQMVEFTSCLPQLAICFFVTGIVTGTAGSAVSLGKYLHEQGSVVSE